jgi:predicted homoserine dehydrogenase-like protein
MMQETAMRAKQLSLDLEIPIGVIGIGSIGKGLAFQAQLTPGIRCVALADIKLDRAVACAKWLQRPFRVVHTRGEMHQAISEGKLAVCQEGDQVAACELADLIIEATNSVADGGRHVETALTNGRHVANMNYEADLMFGPYYVALAGSSQVVYTGCDGDQPAVLKRMVDEIRFWGFEVVMAGNIKGYLDRYANPTSIKPEADKRNLDYRMCASYTDGTKLAIEMAVVANALGFRTAVPGMYGPRASQVHDVFELFDLDALWRDGQGLVDYVLGAQPTGGVFVIGHTSEPFQQFTLDWFPPKMGPGPYYLFYRPYHLGHIEAMKCIFEAVREGRVLLQPTEGYQTNVYAYAKRDLVAGETLDGIGGYACYGMVENCGEQGQVPGLPICLADGLTLKVDIPCDSKLLLSDVDHDPQRADFQMHRKAVSLANEVR